MGYTHYWEQTKAIPLESEDPDAFTWARVIEDIGSILADAKNRYEIAIVDGMGDRGTKPVVTMTYLQFNGSGDDSHETMAVCREIDPDMGWFCKTARKPYDRAVTAVLCYLSSVVGSHEVTSDGHSDDWLAGLELARQALPRYANQLDVPMAILKADRWCGPWTSAHGVGNDHPRVMFCRDGRAYVMVNAGEPNEKSLYAFVSHQEAALWLQQHPDPTGTKANWGAGHSLFRASGSFNPERCRKIAKAQLAALTKLMLDFGMDEGRDRQPPAYVRPGELPPIDVAYSFADVLKLAEEPAE